MTKREICERLLFLYERAVRLNSEYKVFEGIRGLILDLAAPEEEESKADVPIPETPLLWVDGNAPLSPCPECGANCPKLDERTSGLPGAYHYCQSCHAYFVPKHEEGEEAKAEEKHPGVIAKPGKDGEIEFCWCQKCYAQAAVVHDPFGDGENWSYCQKCGVSFRLKRGEGEK